MRKKKPARKSGAKSSKKGSRQDDLSRFLLRYIDAVRFTDSRSPENFPGKFAVRVLKKECCLVIVDWKSMHAALGDAVKQMIALNSISVTDRELANVSNRVASDAMFYAFQFLPNKFDSALYLMLIEALIATAKNETKLAAQREGLDDFLSIEEERVKERLRIHFGPVPMFVDEATYRRALLRAKVEIIKSEKKLTQEAMAEELSKKLEDATIDERTLRRWNKEFGVDWKIFVKESIPDKS